MKRPMCDWQWVRCGPYFMLVHIGNAYCARDCINVPVTRVAHCLPPDGPDDGDGLPLEVAA